MSVPAKPKPTQYEWMQSQTCMSHFWSIRLSPPTWTALTSSHDSPLTTSAPKPVDVDIYVLPQKFVQTIIQKFQSWDSVTFPKDSHSFNVGQHSLSTEYASLWPFQLEDKYSWSTTKTCTSHNFSTFKLSVHHCLGTNLPHMNTDNVSQTTKLGGSLWNVSTPPLYQLHQPNFHNP
jgi:hypothetical protein